MHLLLGPHSLVNAAQSNKFVQKQTPRSSRFIADSSPLGNKAGMSKRATTKGG
jgi:hypothetical protein